eukprot:4047677-Amphidinium_carterae.2
MFGHILVHTCANTISAPCKREQKHLVTSFAGCAVQPQATAKGRNCQQCPCSVPTSPHKRMMSS